MSTRSGREYWESVVSELEASGLTHADFARQRRIKVGSLRGWLYRLRRERDRSEPVRLLPVTVVPSSAPTAHGLVEVDVAGAVVRVSVGTDLAYVAGLVARLRDQC